MQSKTYRSEFFLARKNKIHGSYYFIRSHLNQPPNLRARLGYLQALGVECVGGLARSSAGTAGSSRPALTAAL
jgi:hypothetical protein